MNFSRTMVLIFTALFTLPAAASDSWVNWTDVAGDGQTVNGNVNGVTVQATGTAYDGVQLNENISDTPYFTNSNASTTGTYNNSNVTGPTSGDIIRFSNSGTETITFSQAVVNPLIAFVSWNDAVVSFNAPIQVLSGLTNGCNYWGCGSFSLNNSNTGFTGVNETNGIVEVVGTYTSISFTDLTYENWHGFTVGFENSAPVPEPETITMFVVGLLGLGLTRRKALQA